MAETVCPLCGTERARGAKRCVCHYTFEYDAPRSTRDPRRVGVLALLVAVAGLVGGLAAGPLRGVARDPLLIGLVLCGAGAFAAAGALLDWTWWYAASGKAALFRRVLGHEGTRAFYALLGGALLGGGLRVLLG